MVLSLPWVKFAGDKVQVHWFSCHSLENIKSSHNSWRRYGPEVRKKLIQYYLNHAFLLTGLLSEEIGGYWPIWEEFSSDGQQDSWPSPVNLFSIKKTQKAYSSSSVGDPQRASEALLNDRPEVQNGLRQEYQLKVNLIKLKRYKWHLLFLFLLYVWNAGSKAE